MDGTVTTTVSEDYSFFDILIPFLFRVGTVVVGVVSVAAAVLFAKQDSLLYFPEIGGIPRRPSQNPRKYRSPAEHHIPFESHMIPCSDGVHIHSWLLLHPHSASEGNPTLLFFHGNAGNIGLRLPNAIQMYRDLKANVLLVEYRGYGDSDSVTPSEEGLKLDAEASLNFIASHPSIDSNRIFVFGRSLGGAVGFHLAHYAEKNSINLAGVIVENTFLSVSHMVDHIMPYVSWIKPLVLRIGWNSHTLVPQLKVPTLYLAGSADQLVPHHHMLELYEMSKKASKCARIFIIPGGTHNETWLQGGREYWERIRSFLNEVFAFQAQGATRSISSMEDVPMEEGGDVTTAIGMGSDGDKKRASSIPTMPTNIVGMAREAATHSSVLHLPTKPDTADKKDK